MKAKYKVVKDNGDSCTIEAEHVHCEPNGTVKFLNGRKADATLVAMFAPGTAREIVKETAQ